MMFVIINEYINVWNEIHTIIDNAMKKRDRYVCINIFPNTGVSVNIYPWTEDEDLIEGNEDIC